MMDSDSVSTLGVTSDSARLPDAEIQSPSLRMQPNRPGPITGDTDLVPAPEERVTEEPVTNTAWHRHRLARLDLAMAVMLFILALAVRWPFIERGETLLHSDEPIVGLMAQDIAAARRFPIYFYGQRYMGALEAYVIAAFLPLFDNPVHALRFGPACFFALMVALQFLMLTRWFGRRGGMMGAVALLAASPMFMQWSISARGGYIEILVWGTALLWTYSEWFVAPRPNGNQTWAKLAFGALIGSGGWINPSIILFIVPVIVHALWNLPPLIQCHTKGTCTSSSAGALPHHPDHIPTPSRQTLVLKVTRLLEDRGRFIPHLALPVAAGLGILLLNMIWSVWVDADGVHSELLSGLVPKLAAMVILAVAAVLSFAFIAAKTTLIVRVRSLASDNGAMILGLLLGASPAILYLLQTLFGSQSMDPSLPLGLRPIWKTGETINYLFHGLPLLLGADPQPFLQLAQVGYDSVTSPLTVGMSGILRIAAHLGWLALALTLVGLLISQRGGLSRLFRMRTTNHTPAAFLLIGVSTTLLLYVLGGCALDITTIRYLIPLWAFIPGLLAAVFVDRSIARPLRIAPVCACLAWAIGQMALYQQIGSPHPLRATAEMIREKQIDPAVADILDAQLISYLTQQTCHTIEYDPFWARLGHYAPLIKPDQPVDYIVRTREPKSAQDWSAFGLPGPPPPVTRRLLWPRLRRALTEHPEWLVLREPLAAGYERIRLRRPITAKN